MPAQADLMSSLNAAVYMLRKLRLAITDGSVRLTVSTHSKSLLCGSGPTSSVDKRQQKIPSYLCLDLSPDPMCAQLYGSVNERFATY